jgi:hypothetical protein
MTVKSTTLEAAENNLKELMADVARAVEKAQQAVANITGKATTNAAPTEDTTPSRWPGALIAPTSRCPLHPR